MHRSRFLHKAYGALPNSATLPVGSVTVPTVSNFISDHELTRAERTRWGRMTSDQMAVLHDSFSGGTASEAADMPFRFDLTKVELTVNADSAGTGDTPVHEVGYGLMLHHTFDNGCSASGDFVADTPTEATPAFNCPAGRDTCAAEGLDPIRNFMDYAQDSCMVMLIPGEADRMSDAWPAFRDR